MKTFASQIYQAVQSGRLEQPFDAAMVMRVCPGWAAHTYSTFLAKHAVGNGKESELFVRVGRGQYRLAKPVQRGAGIRSLRGKVKWEGNLEEMRLD